MKNWAWDIIIAGAMALLLIGGGLVKVALVVHSLKNCKCVCQTEGK